jgi:ATP-dependent exoDNAse (exonuclease V) alpha subunit
MPKSIGYVNLPELISCFNRNALRDKSAKIVGILKTTPVTVDPSKFGKTLGHGAKVYCFDAVCAKFTYEFLRQNANHRSLDYIAKLPDTCLIPGRMLVVLENVENLDNNEMIELNVATLELLEGTDTVLLTDWTKNREKSWVCKGVRYTRDVEGDPGKCLYGDAAIPLLEYMDETKKIRVDSISKPYCHGTQYAEFLMPTSAQDMKGSGALCVDNNVKTFENILNAEDMDEKPVNTESDGEKPLDTAWGNSDFTFGDDNIGAVPTTTAETPITTLTDYDATAREDETAESPKKSGIKQRQIVEDRDVVKEPSSFVGQLDDTVNEAKELVLSNLTSLIGSQEEDSSEFVKSVYERIRANWNKKGGGDSGKELFIAALEKLIPATRSKRKGDAESRKLVEELGISIVDIPQRGEVSDSLVKKYPYLEYLSSMHDLFVFTIMQGVAKIHGDFSDIVEYGMKLSVDVAGTIRNNPYNLFVLDSVNLMDMDKLAMIFNNFVNMTEYVKESRYVLAVHEFLTRGADGVGGDTAMLFNKVYNDLTIGYPLYVYDKDRLDKYGCVFEPRNIHNIKQYINPEFSTDWCRYPEGKWDRNRNGAGYILKTPADNTSVAIQKFLDSGWGIVQEIDGQKWIADTVLVLKEQAVYNKIFEMSSNKPTKTLNPADIERCIEEFEQMRNRELGIDNFKLEERQAYAVKLVQSQVMVLTGPAGSGKTTTAEAIVYALENLMDVEPSGIFFAAPTGKAANRLKEIVKRQTYTLHSLFGIGVGLDKMDISSVMANETGDAFITKNVAERLAKMKAIIIDESSMIDINLMYNVMMKLKDDVRLIFLGDIEQLPPIGFGKPFSNILRFAPCVRLTVSKRASEKSGITRNAKELIYNSDDGKRSDMQNSDDFAVVNVVGEQQKLVPTIVENLCRFHLGKMADPAVPTLNVFAGETLNPDDIQVVTPVRTNKYVWGSELLNERLHDVFNPLKNGDKYVQMNLSKTKTIDYRIGDRVIHIKNDAKRERWLDRMGNGTLEQLPSKGVMNGDVGKVRFVYKSLDVTFTDSSGAEETVGKEYGRGDTIFYMAVEYTDVDVADSNCSELKFLVLYEIAVDSFGTNYLATKSKQLYDLNLAYALTIHKMQGSQARLIIMPIFNVGVKGFISRNMIYTGITRAQKGCYLIGSILGNGSAVELGRSHEATSARTSIMDNL